MRLPVVLAAIACALTACSSPGTSNASGGEVLDDTVGMRDSIAGTAAASMNENRVLGLLRYTHATDSALGALGAQRGSTQEIEDFGRMIMREHAALRRDVAAVARGLNIEVEDPRVTPAQAPEQMTQALLATPDGASWDRAYVDYTIAVHDAAMENTARALAATRSPAIREYISTTVPIMQKHVDKARSLQQSLGKAAAPDTVPRP